MLLVVEMWYPANKGPETGKVYFEAMKKFPDDKTISKPIIRTAIHATKDGMHNISISSIKPGKVKEVMDLAQGRMLMFAAIEGFKYTIYIAYDLAEAMPFVGLEAPTE